MMKRATLICSFLFLWTIAVAQTDYKQQYFNAKTLFREGKYSLAMEAFKPVISYDQSNPFSEYASFYYALAAYSQKYVAVAKDMFNQIKKLHPTWDKMEEVDFWLGKIYMDDKEYFQGIKVWNNIKDATLKKNIAILKPSYLEKITDAETLRMMREEYPDDKDIAKALATALAKDIENPDSRSQLEEVIKKYGFDRKDFVTEAPPTYFKDTYSVSVIYPFMLGTLEPTAGKKRNQIILDLYEGMKMAVDTMSKKGINISLRAYDTEHKIQTLQRILALDELKKTDLIIGPFFQDENKLVQDFSMQNRINMLQPFNNLDMMGPTNEFGFLFQPTFETIGRKSAEFLADTKGKKSTCMIFYGPTRRDSIMAAAFTLKASEAGMRILTSQLVTKESAGKIINILATPTEYDQWKKPVQFKLRRDSLGSIFVASDDPLIYSKVISSVETRGDAVTIVGYETWLDQSVLDYEKFQTLGVVLVAPSYTAPANQHYQQFVKKYIRTHGQSPSPFARIGYEMMMFAGNSLKKYGVYFQDAFNKEKLLPGYTSEGFNYQFSHDNQLVPFIRFEGGELLLIRNK